VANTFLFVIRFDPQRENLSSSAYLSNLLRPTLTLRKLLEAISSSIDRRERPSVTAAARFETKRGSIGFMLIFVSVGTSRHTDTWKIWICKCNYCVICKTCCWGAPTDRSTTTTTFAPATIPSH